MKKDKEEAKRQINEIMKNMKTRREKGRDRKCEKQRKRRRDKERDTQDRKDNDEEIVEIDKAQYDDELIKDMGDELRVTRRK